jgi:hypothetical protein
MGSYYRGELTCCLPLMLLITPAVDILENPVVGANCANAVAIAALVMVDG